MVWDIDYIDDARIIVLTLTGVSSGSDLLEAAAARIAAGKKHNCTKFIIDAEHIVVSRSVTMDLYKIPTEVYQRNEAERSSQIAVIRPQDPNLDWIAKFYDDLCTTRGWTAKIVSTREDALDWLNSP